MFKLDLEKVDEPEIKLPTSAGSRKQEFQKNICFCFTDYAKAFDCTDHNKLENPSRDGNTKPPHLPPEKSECPVKKLQLEPDMEQHTGFKSGKEYVKVVYCHPTL